MNLQNCTNEQLMTMLHNVINHSDKATANARKTQLFSVWELRNKAFCAGQSIETISGDGVLSAFRYRVGDGGITKASKRHMILDHIIEAPIPPVVDREYTLKWGQPNSPKRKKRLIRTLKGLVSGIAKRTAHNQDSLSRAKSHWLEDIAYLEKSSLANY